MQPYPTPRRDRRAKREELVRRSARREGGFTLVEFLISSLVMTLVLGSAVSMSMSLQQAYGMQLDDASAEQEARYALDWIARDLRSAGSDPYLVIADAQEVWIDPNAGVDDDDSIRIQADIHDDDGGVPDGPDGDPDDAGEIITIAFDSEANTITRRDHNAGEMVGVAMTDPVFTDLNFTWLDTAKNETVDPQSVAYVRVEVAAESRGQNRFAETGEINEGRHTRVVLSTEVRLRTR